MHGIKYFFLNKNNQTIQGGQKKFPGGARAENITEKHYFSCPPGYYWVRPCIWSLSILTSALFL
jgi:hypothetical protein